jgi:hypothetical protein
MHVDGFKYGAVPSHQKRNGQGIRSPFTFRLRTKVAPGGDFRQITGQTRMSIRPYLFTVLTMASPLAAAPSNDAFATPISLAGSTLAINGDNTGATVQPGENTRNGSLGATVWYSWQCPVSGWVRMDTDNSTADTVLQVFTGSALNALVSQGWNDEDPALLFPGASSITFMATAGTTYRISVGGYESLDFDASEGIFFLNITTGATARPLYWPGTLAFNPVSADVTTAPAPVSAALIVQSALSTGSGTAVLGVNWQFDARSRTFGQPAAWDLSQPQSGSPGFNFNIPRYFPPGTHELWLKILPAEGGEIVFGGPDSGLPNVLPPPPGSSRTISVTNSGPVDELPPELTALTVSSLELEVTAAPATVQFSVQLADQPAGVAWARALLIHPRRVKPLSIALARTAGTSVSGTWTGTLTIPRNYPTENYSVLIETSDSGENTASYGFSGDFDLPGGNLTAGILGGGAYEEWAWSEWFGPDDENTGPSDDADGDGRLNLESFALGLNPLDSASGHGTNPSWGRVNGRLTIQWNQRKALAGTTLIYTPQFTSSLTGLWQDGGANRIVIPIDEEWERISVADTVTAAGSPRRFVRLKMEYFP